MADTKYKAMLVASTADDVLLTTAFTGLLRNDPRFQKILASPEPKTIYK